MFRIDNSSAVAALPVAAAPITPGYFTDGNPGTGVPATIVDAWWCNMLQEEILTVVAAAGITPSKSAHNQLYLALQTLYTASGAATGFLPLTGGTLTGQLTMGYPQPQISWQQTGVGNTAGGLWRIGTDPSGIFIVEMNTAPAGDYSTNVTVLALRPDFTASFANKVTVGGSFLNTLNALNVYGAPGSAVGMAFAQGDGLGTGGNDYGFWVGIRPNGDWSISPNYATGNFSLRIPAGTGPNSGAVFIEQGCVVSGTVHGNPYTLYVNGQVGIGGFLNVAGNLGPSGDNLFDCGFGGNSWAAVSSYSFITVSDPVLKRDIAPVPACLELVRAIEPKTYKWANDEGDQVHWGFLAPDVADAMDRAGHRFDAVRAQENGTRTLAYNDLIAVLWSAVRELADRLDTIESK